jgi:hypothetical protein
MHFDRTSDVVDDPRSAVRALWEGLRYLLLAQAIRPSDIHQLLVPDTPRVGTGEWMMSGRGACAVLVRRSFIPIQHLIVGGTFPLTINPERRLHPRGLHQDRPTTSHVL